ncbi:hypothetical protein [Nocardia fluminea]|uniref:hypothetical protein n=1 Tax=Nocardia fluminea TaxID=134984 RepID=UPI00379EB657
MRAELDGDILFNELMMTRQVDHRLVLLLEGDEDANVVDCHIDESNCRSEIGNGKMNVLRVVDLVVQHEIEWIFFALDRDFDDPTALRSLHKRMSVSDAYDLHSEILLKCDVAVKRLTVAHGKKNRRIAYGTHDRIKEIIVEVSGTLGILRYVSSQRKLNLKLSKFPVQDLIEAYESGNLLDELIDLAITISPNATVGREDLISLMRMHAVVSLPVDYFCQGHDMVAFFSVIIRKRLGGTVGMDVLAESMQSSVSIDCFSRLSIFKDFEAWGKEAGVGVWLAA